MGVTPTITQREVLIKMEGIQERMYSDIKEINNSVKSLDESQRKFQLDYTEEHERVVNTANSAHKRIDEIYTWKADTEKRIKAVEDALIAQRTMNKILVFISSVLGASVITYIWSLIIR